MEIISPIVGFINLTSALFGIGIAVKYAPWVYGCDHISKKCVLGILIVALSLVNLFLK